MFASVNYIIALAVLLILVGLCSFSQTFRTGLSDDGVTKKMRATAISFSVASLLICYASHLTIQRSAEVMRQNASFYGETNSR